MNCRRVKERELHFDSHLSGFVYKVWVHGMLLIKKEIPGPDTVDEFLYEINTLSQLRHAKNVITFYGVVVDDNDQHVTGLLISYARGGTLIDVIYDNHHSLSWSRREKWARQIVTGLSEIHEAGFVQGDFTLSNIVIDENDDARIIDINRRGCPIGWEPPEVTPLIESEQRISMYIGVKSDLYQLGMVLWALATQEDEPDTFPRPLIIPPDVDVPAWYRRVVDTCLNPDPRDRIQAAQLLSLFPEPEDNRRGPLPNGTSRSLNSGAVPRGDYTSPTGYPRVTTVHPPSDWPCARRDYRQPADDEFCYPSRGRSPPSPMPSNQGDRDSAQYGYSRLDGPRHVLPPVPSVSDVLAEELKEKSAPGKYRDGEPNLETYASDSRRVGGSTTKTNRYDESFETRGRSPLVKRPYEGGITGPAENDDRNPISSSALPTLRNQRLGKRADDTGNGDRIRSKANERPVSQADSGKDVTERASTPRGRGGGHRAESTERSQSFSRGKNDKSPTELDPPATSQRGAAAPLVVRKASVRSHSSSTYSGIYRPGESRPEQGRRMYMGAQSHELDTSSRPPTPLPLRQPRSAFERANDLKGIGQALQGSDGFDHTNRVREISDEDLASEFDTGPMETSPKGSSRR